MSAVPMTNDTFAFLKKYYIGRRMLFALDDYKTPLLSTVLKRDNSAAGSTWEQSVDVSAPQGGASTYTTMYANSYTGVQKTFSGGYKKRFADIQVQDFTLRSSRNDAGSVERALKTSIDGMKREFFQELNFRLYRGENSAIGQLDSTTLTAGASTLTLTAATKAGVQYIKPNMFLAFGSADDSSAASGSIRVTARNVQGGSFQCTVVGDVTGSDYVFNAGYVGAGQEPAGLQSWCPLTDTLANSTFKGVDRTIDTNGLGGIRVAGLGESIEESLIDAASVSSQLGEDPDICLIHPKKFAQLRKELGDRFQYTEVKGKPMAGGNTTVSLKGVEIAGSGRPIVVVEDAACQTAATWLIDSNKMQLLSMGTVPFVPAEDGLKMLRRIQGTDQWQSELFAYVEFVAGAPKAITVISHDAAIS